CRSSRGHLYSGAREASRDHTEHRCRAAWRGRRPAAGGEQRRCGTGDNMACSCAEAAARDERGRFWHRVDCRETAEPTGQNRGQRKIRPFLELLVPADHRLGPRTGNFVTRGCLVLSAGMRISAWRLSWGVLIATGCDGLSACGYSHPRLTWDPLVRWVLYNILQGPMTGILEAIRAHASTLPPLAKFAGLMAMIVGIPPLSRRAGIPAVVGFLLGGVLVGPSVLDLAGQHRPIVEFAAELGKLLLMFFCGLEINLTLFRQARKRCVTFGLLTTLIPLLLGT